MKSGQLNLKNRGFFSSSKHILLSKIKKNPVAVSSFFHNKKTYCSHVANINPNGKVFFFDMNGTLCDSKVLELKCHHFTLAHIKKKYNLDFVLPSLDELAKQLDNMLAANPYKIIYQLYPKISDLREEYSKFSEEHFEERRMFLKEEYFIKSAVNFIKKLIDENHKVCIVSGSHRKDIERNLKELEIFGSVPYLGCEDYEYSKPHPEPYLRAAHLMSVLPNRETCIVFENSEYGIIAAKKAGMFAVGFSENSLHDSLLIKSGADLVIGDFSEIQLERAINFQGRKTQ